MEGDTAYTSRLTKRSLVSISHAIEHAALATAEDGPMLVFAMFQRPPYWEREQSTYSRIAASAAVTVVGAVELATQSTGSSNYVGLDPAEALAREWSVVVLTPRFGAALVALDREEVDGEAASLESGRLFDGSWQVQRDAALHEAIRLRQALPGRLHPDALASIDGVIDRVRDVPAGQGERRHDASLRLVVERLERSIRQAGRLREQVEQLAAAAPSPQSPPDATQLRDESYLRRWADEGRPTASGTLSVALIGVRLTHHHQLPERFGRRVDAVANATILRLIASVLRPVDRAVRIGEWDIMLILPSLSMSDAVATARQIGVGLSEIALSSASTMHANVVVGVTRRRPLPIGEVTSGLN